MGITEAQKVAKEVATRAEQMEAPTAVALVALMVALTAEATAAPKEAASRLPPRTSRS